MATATNVTVIPAKPQTANNRSQYKQLRVAAYCRVSTEQEEQQNSYQVQIEYYTDLIHSKKEWTLAGIFADEGISGTQTKKRTEFNRMIRMCKQKKIDLILTKSISRFARNTVDCLEYVRIHDCTVWFICSGRIGIHQQERIVRCADGFQRR